MRKGYGLVVCQTEASWVGYSLCFFLLGTLLYIFFLNLSESLAFIALPHLSYSFQEEVNSRLNP